MFPTKHDITTHNYDDCRIILKKILKAGNEVLIVSKPDDMVIERLTYDLKKWKDQILFRFTIGSLDDDILEFLEPGAPSFFTRMTALQIAFEKGYETSVSMEPLLDNKPENTKKLVKTLLPFVSDAIWIGKMNRPEKRLKIEMNDFIKDYLSRESDENIFEIYEMFKENPQIKWKESIKEVVGIEVPTEKGLDI